MSAASAGSERVTRPVGDADRFVACATLATWVGCAAVGLGGLVLSYKRFVLPPKPPADLVAVQTLRVELTSDADAAVADGPARSTEEREAGPAGGPPTPEAATPALEFAPPAAPEVPRIDPAPTLAEVATPAPAPAPAAPVASPAAVQVPAGAPAGAASASGSPVPPPAGAPAAGPSSPPAGGAGSGGGGGVGPGGPEAGPARTPGPAGRITFGVGEGRQPRPDYPAAAVRSGQEGRVVVRFTVGEDGRVAVADVIEPCKWPLLNQAAARGVRDRWRFSPGPVRVYDVNIVFRLDD